MVSVLSLASGLTYPVAMSYLKKQYSLGTFITPKSCFMKRISEGQALPVNS